MAPNLNTYIFEQSGDVYSFELDLSAKAKEFAGISGKYHMRLIVGDAAIANPVSWHLADVGLSFGADVAPAAAASADPESGPKPEIAHQFRQPEKRPPAAVSNAFTLLCLVPFAVLFGAWAKLGVNVSGFPVSVSSLGKSHLNLAGLFPFSATFSPIVPRQRRALLSRLDGPIVDTERLAVNPRNLD